jgi:hypothetical protein
MYSNQEAHLHDGVMAGFQEKKGSGDSIVQTRGEIIGVCEKRRQRKWVLASSHDAVGQGLLRSAPLAGAG